MPLRMTDKKNTRRFEDGDAWIELRVGGLSKGETDRLNDAQRSLQIDTPDGVLREGDAQKIEINIRTAEANRVLFGILCTNWSLDADPSEQAYSDLDEESGNWVDECLAEVLRERRERAEGNPEASRTGSSKRRSGRASSSSSKAA